MGESPVTEVSVNVVWLAVCAVMLLMILTAVTPR